MPSSISSSLDTGYFINNSENNNGDYSSVSTSEAGYWEPHTSSIDFCESNYLLSPHIVEPHNVWSSLFGLSLFGILGILYGNPTNEWRIFLIYFILLIIGLGSACLHASLHWCFQSFDELPMIYLVVVGLFAIIEVDSPRRKPKYPRLAIYLVLLSCINTAVYYKYQHLYLIFLLTFSGLTVVAFGLHVQIAKRLYDENKKIERGGTIMIRGKKIRYNNNAIALRFYKLHGISYVLIASPIWVLDQFHCGYLLPIYNALPFPLKGMTLHVVWHTCAGLGVHYFVQFLCAVRASELGMECDTKSLLGILPVVTVAKESKAANGNVKQA